MRISHRYRFVFFSNPKTGSESVRSLLNPFSDIFGVPYWEVTRENPFYSHISPEEVIEIFSRSEWDYFDYYSFTFVRNPWARLVSLYGMIHGGSRGRIEVAKEWMRRIATGEPTHPSIEGFRAWLPTIRPDGAGGGGAMNQRWQRYGTYSIRAYAFGSHGQQVVRKIIRLEDIDMALPGVIAEIGLPDAQHLVIPRVNTRTHKPYVQYYDDVCRMFVEQHYAFDIERFGYCFGD